MGGGSQSCKAGRAAAHRRWQQGRTTAPGGATQVMRVLPGPLTGLSVSPDSLFSPTSSFLPFSSSSPLLSPSSRLRISFSFANSPSSLSSGSFSGLFFHRPRFLSRPLSQTFSFLVPTFLDFLSPGLLFSFFPLWLSPPRLCSVVWSPLPPPTAPRRVPASRRPPPTLLLVVISHPRHFPREGLSRRRCCSTARGN